MKYTTIKVDRVDAKPIKYKISKKPKTPSKHFKELKSINFSLKNSY